MIAAGVTATSQFERGGPPDFATGLWGVELERARAWSTDATTRADLGRAFDVSAERFGADVEAQAYSGFRSYADHLATVARTIPAQLAPTRGSTWGWRLAMAAYSSGPAAVINLLRAAAQELEAAPEEERWRVLARAVIDAATRGARELGGVPLAGRWRAAYLLLRCERRFRAGLALARAIAPAEVAWYAGQLDDGTIARLESIARGDASSAAMPGAEPSGLTWVRGPASALGVRLGGTAAEALATSRAVACGPMFNARGALYGLRDAARGVAVESTFPSRGATVVVEAGRARMLDQWSPAAAGVAVQGYPALVSRGQPLPVAASPSERRVALAILGDGAGETPRASGRRGATSLTLASGTEVALVCGIMDMRAFARALAAGGARGAIYLDGGRAAHLETRDNQAMRHGNELPAAWIVL
jgi:hypothetical protein